MTGAARMSKQSINRARLNNARSAAARGIIGPGDPAPPPGYDVLDYRGLLDARQLTLGTAGLPIGRIVDVRRGPGRQIALPLPLFVRHSCVIGPSGAGKTQSIIVPWIVALLASGWSVVTVDVKGDLLGDIQGYLRETGQYTGAQGLVWDYNAARTHRWNFLQEISSEQSVDAAVLSLLGRQKENDSQPYFYKRDYRWLKAVIRLALELRGRSATPRLLMDLLSDQDSLARQAAGSRGRADLNDLIGAHPQDYGRDVSGLLNALALFTEPSVERAVATSDFTLQEVAQTPSLLVAVAKLSDGLRGEQLSSLLLSQFVLTILHRFGSAIPRPLAFVIDEAPRIRDRIDLEQVLSVARGANAGVCLAAQDVAQFGDERQQSALLANCHTYISMAGVSPASATYFSSRLGTRMRDEFTLTNGGNRTLFEGPQMTRQSSTAPVIGAREIMFPPWGNHPALVHCPSVSIPPFMISLDR
jgi:type IV secretory pathway TraG/TraD family ATPase VirD4